MRRRGTFVARRRNDADWIQIGLFLAASIAVAMILCGVLLTMLFGIEY